MKRQIIKVSAITYARLIEAMIDGDLTCRELAEETGLHYVTVLQYVRELHKVGAVHVAYYELDNRGRATTRVFKLGRGKDAKRAPKTSAQRQQQSRKLRREAKLLGLFDRVSSDCQP